MKYLIIALLLASPIAQGFENITTYSFTGSVSRNGGDYTYIPDSFRGVMQSTIIADDVPLVTSIVLDTQDNPIEEAWVEYEYSLSKTKSIFISVGTADVLYGFYNNGLDVLTAGSGVLPQGVYSYDFVKGGFSRIYGTGLEFRNILLNSGIEYKFKVSTGKSLVDSKHYHETSLFNGKESDNVDITDAHGIITSFSISYYDDIEFFLLNSKHSFYLDNHLGSVVDLPTYLAATPDYILDIDRWGIRVMFPTFTEITYEGFKLNVINDNPVVAGSKGGYLVMQQYSGNTVYKVGLSRAIGDDHSEYTTDKFIGISYTSELYSIGLEHHKGHGSAWLTSGNTLDWSATILTFGVNL